MSQFLSVLCTEFPRVCRRMADRWSWNTLSRKCERVYAKYGGKLEEIPTESVDALEAFDDTNVETCVFRFVAYIMWLKRQPDSFEAYLRVRDLRHDLWRSCVYKLWML